MFSDEGMVENRRLYKEISEYLALNGYSIIDGAVHQ